MLVGYASGDIYLLQQQNGNEIWQNNVNLYQNTVHQDYLLDINANLIIADNAVFVVGNGGLLKSLKLADGSLLWQINESSLINFWLVSDNLFFIKEFNYLRILHIFLMTMS